MLRFFFAASDVMARRRTPPVRFAKRIWRGTNRNERRSELGRRFWLRAGLLICIIILLFIHLSAILRCGWIGASAALCGT